MKRSGGRIRLLAAIVVAAVLNVFVAGVALAAPIVVVPLTHEPRPQPIEGWGGWQLPAILLFAALLTVGLVARRATRSHRSSLGALSPAGTDR